MSSLLTVIRDAIRPGAQTHALELIEGEPDANASISQPPLPEALSTGGSMSVEQTVAAAAIAASVTTAANAASSGGQDGAQAATDRLMTIFAAETIKGDAGRMSAAVQLAAKAPAMSADDVVAFVATHVAATAPASAPPASAPPEQNGKPAPAATYEQQRLNAAALAQPGGTATHSAQPKLSASGIYEMRRNALKGA